MGVIHTIYHLSSNRDRIELPTVALQPRGKQAAASRTAALENTKNQLLELIIQEGFKKNGGVFMRALKQSLVAVTTGMFVYLPVRHQAWRYTLKIARLFYRISNINEPHSWPVGPWFFLRTIWVSFLIFLLWEVANTTFKIFFSMEPLKDGEVLSNGSMDKNGTLVTGFKQPGRPLTQVYHLGLITWEELPLMLRPGHRILGARLHQLQPPRAPQDLLHRYRPAQEDHRRDHGRMSLRPRQGHHLSQAPR